VSYSYGLAVLTLVPLGVATGGRGTEEDENGGRGQTVDAAHQLPEPS